MFKSTFHFALLTTIAFMVTFSSCTKEESTDGLVEFTDETMYMISMETRSGQTGCYELVFPVTVEFPDSTSLEVDDYESLKNAIKEWRSNNDQLPGRPKLALPFEVIDDEGEVISVETRLEAIQLRRACRAEMGGPGHTGHVRHCFRLVFPIEMSMPNGEVVEFSNRRGLKTFLRQWKKNNPDAASRPMLVFPLEVKFKDGSTQTIESKEDLKALKEDCREG